MPARTFLVLSVILTFFSNAAIAATPQLTGVVATASGDSHACALLDGGEVRCWGNNASGQLGDGTQTSRVAPVKLQGPSAIAIAAGGSSTCLLDAGHEAWCYGQLNNHIAGITIATISVGGGHACILSTSGDVSCWGENGQGQLGNGTTTSSPSLVTPTGLGAGVLALSAGRAHTCAITALKRVKCWGANGFVFLSRTPTGQIGDGTSLDSSTPVDVVDLDEDVAVVSAGDFDTCAITAAGATKCWGNGILRPAPANVPAGAVATDGAGFLGHFTSCCLSLLWHRCAILSTGQAQCWGQSFAGELGDGTVQVAPVGPRSVIGLSSGVTSISAGSNHMCAVRQGDAYCWGSKGLGRLGDGTTTSATPAVANVTGLPAVAAIAAGGLHTCARTSAGAAWCWGSNGSSINAPLFFPQGQLGDGSLDNRAQAVPVSGLASGVSAIDGGGSHSCAVTQAGGVKCWGANFAGQLGDGTTTQRSAPVDVAGLAGNATAVAAGSSHTCALIASGAVQCWGSGSAGQLGNGSNTNSSVPVTVANLPGPAIEIVAGADHTCARAGESLVCWGLNNFGQLGDQTTTNRNVATLVPGFSGVAGIALGTSHTCALNAGGGVKCWGSSGSGQLGNNLTADSLSPVDVLDMQSGIAKIVAGNAHNCALTTTGGVRCWGFNSSGQVGDGTTLTRRKPMDVPNFASGYAGLAGGGAHTCALAATGAVQCWGQNSEGELGIGVMTYPTLRSVPAPVLGGMPLAVARVGTGSGTVTSDVGGISCGSTCSAFFDLGASATLTAVAQTDSAFTGWTGGGCSGTGTCTVAVSDATVVTASFVLSSPVVRPVNISTRGTVGTGDDVLIGGFIIGGSSSKRVILTVAGPSLTSSGIANPLADPRVTLVRSSDGAVVATNDDWQAQDPAAVAAIQSTGLQPNNALEPAILATLAPGGYTAIVNGVGGGTGVGLIGVFEVDGPNVPLRNISTRGEVLTGNDVMIAGFIVAGSSAQQVVVNVAGPSLANFGVPNPLGNPTVTVVRASDNAIIASNDNWQSQSNPNDVAAIQATGFQPNNALEPALILTLQPGAYTAVVQGAGATTGIALVGVFAVP